MRVAYKLVRTGDSESVSLFTPEPLLVRYVPGRWSEAKAGGLLVFRRAESAMEFLEDVLSFEFATLGVWCRGFRRVSLWRCAVGGRVKLPRLPLRTPVLRMWSTRKTGAWWLSHGLRDPENETCSKWPPGTEAWREVMLTECLLEMA